ncbi:unnamed protein product [Parnassius mnemosyne]|uniref:Serine racemase n=1 Tax=Parnassius mnemosyne TaxID=213953 RepID=A0AAV1KN54_9NEOP
MFKMHNPSTQTVSLGKSPGALANRNFTKHLNEWCPEQNNEFDPWCDPDYPMIITYKDIVKAKNFLKKEFHPTPLVESKHNHRFPMNIYYKLETFHRTGSFKERGAFYSLSKLSTEQKEIGVITASLGNWAMALACCGQKLNIPVTVVLPVIASMRADQICRDFGATVVTFGKNLAEAKRKAFTMLTNANLSYINGYDHPHVIAASGTIGMEILKQLPKTDAILVPVGGGSLLAGIAVAVKHIKPDVLVYGIESDRCPSFSKALEKSGVFETDLQRGLANSLEVSIAGCNAFETAKNLIKSIILIDNDWIAKALLHLIEDEKLIVEGAAAVPLASLMALPRALIGLKDKTVVCVLSGGNLEPCVLQSLERAQALEGRLITVNVKLPGLEINNLQKIFNIIAKLGCNVIRHNAEKSWGVESYMNEINVSIICATRDQKHAHIVKKVTEKFFPNICKVHQEVLCTSEKCKCYSCKNNMHK